MRLEPATEPANRKSKTPTTMAALEAGKRRSATVALWITYINIVLYALCYQLQRPVEPFLVAKLTTSADGDDASDATTDDAAIMYGRVQSFFSAIQTVGSPLVGILLDRIGIRRTSALVFAASAVSYAILAHATDLTTLFLSKIPTVLQHAFLVAQATAATEAGSDDAVRAQALGRMTTSYTIGATIGPALGGYLAHGDGDDSKVGDMYFGAWLAVVGSIISVVLSLLYLPDEHYHAGASSDASTKGKAQQQSNSFLADVKKTVNIAARSHIWPLLAVKVIGGVARSMHSTALPLALKEGLDFDPAQLGMVMSSASLAVAAFGAFALKPSTNALGSEGLARLGLAFRGVMAISIAHIVSSYSLSESLSSKSPVFIRICTASVAHALASHALATSLTTMTTGAVPASERGAILGLEHGLFSFVGVFAPTAGTALLARGGGFLTVALVNAAIDAILVGALYTWAQTRRSFVGGKSGSQTDKDEHSD